MIKPTLGNFRAAQLYPVEAFLLTLKGKRDGRIGLPRQNEDAEWSSPHYSREVGAYHELASKKWAEAEHKTAGLHSEIAAMERNIANRREQLADLQGESPAAPDLSYVYPGESGIDPGILRDRRHREHTRANARYYKKREELRTYIEQTQDKISELKAAIAECENITRLICERAKQRTEQRIAAYWYGLLCTNTDQSVPAVPGKIAEADAEAVYFTYHGSASREPVILNKGGASI